MNASDEKYMIEATSPEGDKKEAQRRSLRYRTQRKNAIQKLASAND